MLDLTQHNSLHLTPDSPEWQPAVEWFKSHLSQLITINDIDGVSTPLCTNAKDRRFSQTALDVMASPYGQSILYNTSGIIGDIAAPEANTAGYCHMLIKSLPDVQRADWQHYMPAAILSNSHTFWNKQTGDITSLAVSQKGTREFAEMDALIASLFHDFAIKHTIDTNIFNEAQLQGGNPSAMLGGVKSLLSHEQYDELLEQLTQAMQDYLLSTDEIKHICSLHYVPSRTENDHPIYYRDQHKNDEGEITVTTDIQCAIGKGLGVFLLLNHVLGNPLAYSHYQISDLVSIPLETLMQRSYEILSQADGFDSMIVASAIDTYKVDNNIPSGSDAPMVLMLRYLFGERSIITQIESAYDGFRHSYLHIDDHYSVLPDTLLSYNGRAIAATPTLYFPDVETHLLFNRAVSTV